jgi:crossover junction endodeoxyribonuclease RuvC
MIILGIDPSLRSTGYGAISYEAGKPRLLTFGEIKNPPARSQLECLTEIHRRITEVIAETKPQEAAVEGIIYIQNHRIAITLGAARGAALLALSHAGLPVYEYAPRQVKSAATGRGGAQKQQVAFMMRALLGLTQTPPPDAADALAIALTHAQSSALTRQTKRL